MVPVNFIRRCSTMPVITLPDGSTRSYDHTLTALDLALDISEGLARACVAAHVDGVLTDLRCPIERDAAVSLVKISDPEALSVIRHSCAHLLAHAVKSLYPEVQVTIGPVVENGFYYDFARDEAFSEHQFEAIEAKMTELARAKLPLERLVWSREEAVAYFKEQGEHYKVEIIESIDSSETLTCYRQGDFIDLCRGPHIQHTGQLKAFHLTKLAGAYWRGDASQAMLQRIYGTAWPTQEALKAYLHRLEEAKRRDHRLVGKKMGLFHFQEEAAGMAFWHPAGWRIIQTLKAHLRELYGKYGYQEIATPQLVDVKLWERSGHWDKYSENMYVVESEGHRCAVKPMNCPCHVQVFNQGLRSYRELPLRLAEFGSCHRYEPSGTLHGLMRLRNFVQDDAHIFCTPDQVHAEVVAFNEQTLALYRAFGFEQVSLKLSTRPERRVGSDAIWDQAEQALEDALNAAGVPWEVQPGEGAFYGPKIEFSLHDCLGRVWQCGTMQVDFSMPERLGASYIDEQGQKCVPVMLHRAMLGSLERFLAILIEETAGVLPFWLAPVQVVVAGITSAQDDYVASVVQALEKKGCRVEGDLRPEKIGFKIREHAIRRVPYVLIAGAREAESGEVSVRDHQGQDLGAMTVEAFWDRVSPTH